MADTSYGFCPLLACGNLAADYRVDGSTRCRDYECQWFISSEGACAVTALALELVDILCVVAPEEE